MGEILLVASRLSEPIVAVLASLLLRVSAVMGLAILSAWLLRRSSSETRHRLWLAAFCAALMVLALSLSGPLLRLNLAGDSWAPRAVSQAVLKLEGARASLGFISPRVPGAANPSETPEGAGAGVGVLLRAAGRVALATFWLGGAAAGLLRLVYGRILLGRLIRAGTQIGPNRFLEDLCRRTGIRRRTVRVTESARCSSPMTRGVARPVIVLPSAMRRWPQADREAVLLHELLHVKRADSLYRTVAFCICSLLWFVAPVWTAYRRLCLEQEMACDAAVVAGGVTRHSYAECLLEAARISRGPALEVGFSFLEGRARSFKDRLGAILEKSEAVRRGGVLLALTAFALASIAASGALGRSAINLFAAARSGTPEQVLAALRDGCPVDERAAGNGMTPLMVAASYNPDAEVTRALLGAGADPAARGFFHGALAAELAALANPNPGVIAALLRSRAGKADSPTWTAALFEDLSWDPPTAACMEKLMNAGLDIDAAGPGGLTPLMIAARHDNPAMVRMLLALGASGTLRDRNGRTAFDQMNSKLRGTEVAALLQAACR